ncbi:MAG: U32 family peptidase, partial [Erysipelotrichaceae bacterium]|nr:U32 family peptidase [Erysipelotrichaceae bacterium]
QCDLQELEEYRKQTKRIEKKLFVNVCQLFSEEELEECKEALTWCRQVGVDGIYYADEGVYTLAQEMGMTSLLIYQPETLITNHLDVEYYLNKGIQSVSLAHELSIEEIKKIAQYQTNIEILIQGTYSVLYSRRPLIKNYLQAHQIESRQTSRFDLIEQTRSDRFPIIEDASGTHIFTEKEINSIRQYPLLKEMGIARFRIDSLFHDDDWTLKVLKAYAQQQDFQDGSDHWYHQQSVDRKEGDSNETD